MKRCLTLIAVLFSFGTSYAQQGDSVKVDTTWKHGGFINLNFNQVSLSNWAAGGDNSIAIASIGNVFANYATLKQYWENSLDLAYGLTKTADDPIRKFDDKIELNSRYGRKIKGNLYLSGLVNFKSQFQPGYDYTNPDSVFLLSRFFSPASILASIGLDWKPKEYFSLYFSPVTAKFTFVEDQQLADLGAFGVDPLTIDPVTLDTTPGKNLRAEFGAYLSLKFKKDIFKNVNLETKLDLFDNYTDKVVSNRDNVDVNWTVLLAMKVNKFLVASLSTELIYDHNTPVPLYSKDAEGNKYLSGAGPRTQFKEVLSIGLSFKF